jgi:cell division protein ZapB
LLILDRLLDTRYFTYLPCNNLVITMTQSNQSLELKDLEDKLDQLIEHYANVKNENNLLKTKQDSLVREKAKLLEKTTLARTRVEAMITRLKAMENGS